MTPMWALRAVVSCDITLLFGRIVVGIILGQPWRGSHRVGLRFAASDWRASWRFRGCTLGPAPRIETGDPIWAPRTLCLKSTNVPSALCRIFIAIAVALQCSMMVAARRWKLSAFLVRGKSL